MKYFALIEYTHCDWICVCMYVCICICICVFVYFDKIKKTETVNKSPWVGSWCRMFQVHLRQYPMVIEEVVLRRELTSPMSNEY
jgi:amino acid permease